MRWETGAPTLGTHLEWGMRMAATTGAGPATTAAIQGTAPGSYTSANLSSTLVGSSCWFLMKLKGILTFQQELYRNGNNSL